MNNLTRDEMIESMLKSGAITTAEALELNDMSDLAVELVFKSVQTA